MSEARSKCSTSAWPSGWPQNPTTPWERQPRLQQTQQGSVLGTPQLHEPRAGAGQGTRPSHRSSSVVGVVLYELAHRPECHLPAANFAEIVNRIVHIHPPAIARLNYDVPPELERITLKCLQKLPDRRYQSARELLVDLKNLRREIDAVEDLATHDGLVSLKVSAPRGTRRS